MSFPSFVLYKCRCLNIKPARDGGLSQVPTIVGSKDYCYRVGHGAGSEGAIPGFNQEKLLNTEQVSDQNQLCPCRSTNQDQCN